MGAYETGDTQVANEFTIVTVGLDKRGVQCMNVLETHNMSSTFFFLLDALMSSMPMTIAETMKTVTNTEMMTAQQIKGRKHNKPINYIAGNYLSLNQFPQ